MFGGKSLLLLAVLVLLARCQQKPKVLMLPTMKSIFTGDLLYLSCHNDIRGSEVKWYFNNNETKLTNKTWKIAVASSKHSGSYQCEIDGQKSDNLQIKVLEFLPSASLSIKTGQPVMHIGHGVILGIVYEDNLQGWDCWVYRKALDSTKKIKFKLENNGSARFQSKKLEVPETIFWCTDKEMRSNQIIVRASAQPSSLEMDPFPAVIGKSLTLKCLVWGTNDISKAVFYKDSQIIYHGSSSVHIISTVTEDTKGLYGCNASYIDNSGTHFETHSDFQDLFVQESPIMATLSVNKDLTCSCSQCGSDTTYHYYKKTDAQEWKSMGSHSGSMTPQENGIYACKAVWRNGRSVISTSHSYPNSNATGIIIVLVLVIMLTMLVICFVWYKRTKRNTTGQIYEEVAMALKDNDDNKYEILQHGPGAKREDEYDTLHQGATGGEGGYEALRKEGMKGDIYHSLGEKGAARGEGGYEALKKEGMKEGVYHSLGGRQVEK